MILLTNNVPLPSLEVFVLAMLIVLVADIFKTTVYGQIQVASLLLLPITVAPKYIPNIGVYVILILPASGIMMLVFHIQAPLLLVPLIHKNQYHQEFVTTSQLIDVPMLLMVHKTPIVYRIL